jgi:hypothetical protein
MEISKDILDIQQQIRNWKRQIADAERTISMLKKRENEKDEAVNEFQRKYGFKPTIDSVCPPSVIPRDKKMGWGVTKYKYILKLHQKELGSFESMKNPYNVTTKEAIDSIQSKYEGITFLVDEGRVYTTGTNGCGMGNEDMEMRWRWIYPKVNF